VAAAASPAAAGSKGSSRGVYMALGGLLVVLLLFAGGFYLPKIIKTHASPGSAQPAPPASQPAAAADAPVDISAPPADAVTVTAPAQEAPPAAAPAPPQEDPAVVRAREEAARKAREEAARKAALMKECEQQSDQLEARSAAIGAGLNSLRRQQQAAGYGLRGDITQAEQMMQINMARAQSAMHQGNPDQAKEYLDKAENQAMVLERFLGR